MTALFLYIMLWLWDNRTFDAISKTNERKILAENAYNNKQYGEAVNLYHKITYGTMFSDPAARLNLAHSYYHLGKFADAKRHYELLARVNDHAIASVALSQVGIIQVAEQDTAAALESLIESLRLESDNKLARENYIFLKSRFSGIERKKPENNQTTEKKKQELKEEQAAPKVSQQEVLADKKKEDFLNSLKKMNMTEEQARAVLDAMKTSESQYIYQLRRKQYASQKQTDKKVEW